MTSRSPWRLDGVDGGQQGDDRPLAALMRIDAVDGELHVLGGDVVAVGELQAVAQRAGVALVAGCR